MESADLPWKYKGTLWDTVEMEKKGDMIYQREWPQGSSSAGARNHCPLKASDYHTVMGVGGDKLQR